jgi:thymidylate synthase
MKEKKMASYHDQEYLEMLVNVKNLGYEKEDRTGTGTRSLFGYEMTFDVSDGTIPLLTTKKMFSRGIIHELLWFISGSTNIRYLQENNVRIWNEWADENGDLGPLYGAMWRRFPNPIGASINYETDPPTTQIEYEYVDQLGDAIQKLRTNPNDRRIIVNAWHPGLLPKDGKTFSENVADGRQALPPCHYSFQFWVADGKLSLKLTQRSADVFLGVPFNIAQYSMLLHMVASITGLRAGEFIWSGGDVHIYNNHFDAIEEQLRHKPVESPKFWVNPLVKEIDDFTFDDLKVVDYNCPYERISAPVAV